MRAKYVKCPYGRKWTKKEILARYRARPEVREHERKMLQKWRKKNPQKIKIQQSKRTKEQNAKSWRKYQLTHKDKIKENRFNRLKKERETLSDWYVHNCLKTSIPMRLVPKILIEAKRLQIKLLRETRKQNTQ